MTHQTTFYIVLATLILILLIGCQEVKKPVEIQTEAFSIYASKDTFLSKENAYQQIAYIDKSITLEQSKTVFEKLTIIADTLSNHYFNGLSIELTDNFPDGNGGSIVKVNLVERPEFKGPGSLHSYQSWYDFFQGTMGGTNTTIILKESLLQRDYKGQWINGLVFYYQGKPIGEFDHIDLYGIIKR